MVVSASTALTRTRADVSLVSVVIAVRLKSMSVPQNPASAAEPVWTKLTGKMNKII